MIVGSSHPFLKVHQEITIIGQSKIHTEICVFLLP